MAAEVEAERGRGRAAAAEAAAQLRSTEEALAAWQERFRCAAAEAKQQQEEAAEQAQALSGQIAAKANELRLMVRLSSHSPRLPPRACAFQRVRAPLSEGIVSPFSASAGKGHL